MMIPPISFGSNVSPAIADYRRRRRLSTSQSAKNGAYSIQRTMPTSTQTPVCNSTARATYDTTTNALNASHATLNSTHASATTHVTYHGCTVEPSNSIAPATVAAAREGR